MSIFDRLLAGERVTVEAHGQRFDLTYGPAEDPRLTTYYAGGATSTSVAVDAARAHVEEQAKRYGWRDADAPAAPAAPAEIEAPVAAIIADAVAAIEAQTPSKPAPVKIEVAKVKVAPVKAEKREPTFDVEETPTERPNKKSTAKKKGKR